MLSFTQLILEGRSEQKIEVIKKKIRVNGKLIDFVIIREKKSKKVIALGPQGIFNKKRESNAKVQKHK